MADTDTQQQQKGSSPLTHKVGPLPVWAYGVVIFGAIILYKIIKDRQSNAQSSGGISGQNNANSLFGTEGFSVNGQGQIVDNATGGVVGTTGSGSGSQGSTSTAADWISQAEQTLFQLGYSTESTQQALQDYTSGNKLSPSEFGIIESAIALLGNPPSPLGTPQELGGGTPPPTAGPVQPTYWQTGAPPAFGDVFKGTNVTPIGNVIKVLGESGTAAGGPTGWVYITDKGYVYTSKGAQYYGGTDGGFIGGSIASHIVDAVPITQGKDAGGYSLIASNGDTYNFGPGTSIWNGFYPKHPSGTGAKT